MKEIFNSEEHQIFRDTVKNFISKEITPQVDQWEAQREVPRDLWIKMGNQGFLCPWLPEKFGGQEVGFDYSVIINEELIRGDGFGVGVPMHNDVATPYVYAHASPEIKESWLPRCTTGEVITAIGFTEPDTGSDLAAIRSRAERVGGFYVINGQKTFITNGYCADLFVVAVKTDVKAGHQGISLILVDKDAPGFSKGRRLEKMGYHMQDTAELYFENCRVPISNRLGEEGKGFKYMMEKMQQERLEVCIKCQVNAEEALKEALNYAKSRNAFGRSIGNFQHNAFKLAEMATEVQVGRSFLNSLIADHIKGKNIVQQVSMAKYWLAEMANRIAYQAVQIHGGYGYMEEYRICRIYRDVRCLPIMAGTSEIMKLIISRNLGLTPL